MLDCYRRFFFNIIISESRVVIENVLLVLKIVWRLRYTIEIELSLIVIYRLRKIMLLTTY